MARACRLSRVSAGLCKKRDEAAEQPDEPDEAGASDGASRVVRVLGGRRALESWSGRD
jgi:hypothetical protein